MPVNWQLENCCGDKEEIVFLCCYAFYTVLTFALMEYQVMKPMKLISIFIHEFGHAVACWCTGGKVDKIEVWGNEGGITSFNGGFRPFIIPAGYVGVSFAGGVFVSLSGSRLGATVAASVFGFALIVCLKFSPNKLLVGLCLGFILVTLACLLVDWLFFDPFIQYITLFYGVFVGWYGIMDIYDDTVSRTVEQSDAYACYKMWPCCLPRLVGVQFAILAIFFQALGLYLALVWLTHDNIPQ